MSPQRSRISTDDVLSMLYAFIHQVYGPDVRPVSVRIDLGPILAPWRCTFPPHLPRRERDELPLADLREIEQALLQAARDRPETPKALARRAGYRWNSYTREAVARLVSRGLLTRGPGGVTKGQQGSAG